MNDDTNWVSFDSTLLAFGNNTGIEVPDDVLAKLNAGKRPSLMVRVNGYTYQVSPGTMDGRTMLSFSADHRQKSGLQGGDQIHVELAVATGPREVELSDDFRQALEASGTWAFFESLSNSLQRYHCDQINGAKTEETRERRIEKAIGLFKEGKKR